MDGQDWYKIGERYGSKITFHRLCLEEVDRLHGSKLVDILDKIVLYVFYTNDEKKIKENLGMVSKYFKMVGNDNRYQKSHRLKQGDYMYFVNAEMLGDYAVSDVNEASQGLDKWLLIEKQFGGTKELEEHFYSYFPRYLEEFFQQERMYKKEKELTFDSFVSEVGLWATKGSGGQSIKFIEEWTSFKGQFPNNKKILGLLSDKNKLIKKCLNLKKQRLKVNIKRELVKSRGVVNSDIYTYLMMAYVNYLVEDTLYGSEHCTLFQKSSQDRKLFLRNLKESFENYELNVPLDQSAFDSQVSHKMIKECYKVYYNYCKKFFSEENDLKLIMDKIGMILTEGDVIIGKDIHKFKNGIPSGWRWTSMFDSAINYAQVKSVEAILNDIGICTQIKNITVQGDDVQCYLNSDYAAEAVIALMNYCGMEINRKKMYTSRTRSEYLRNEYSLEDSKFSIRGIPLRSVPSLFFRSPIKGEMLTLNSLIDQWIKVIGRYRLQGSNKIMNLMITDISNYLKKKNQRRKINLISRQDIFNYLCTPSYLGGYGLDINEIDQNVFNDYKKNYTMILIKEKSYYEYKNNEEEQRIKLLKEKMIATVIKCNKLGHVRNDGIRYINEEMNIYGEHKRYYYEIQPLRNSGNNNKKMRFKKGRILKYQMTPEIFSFKKCLEENSHPITSLVVRKTIINERKNYDIIIDNNELYEMLKTKTIDQFNYENRYFNGYYIKRDQKSIDKWKDSSIGFRNQVLLRNESFISHYKSLYCGQNIFNLLVSDKIEQDIRTVIYHCQWSVKLLEYIQHISSRYVVDTTTIVSSE